MIYCFPVGADTYSLDDIEHKILRKMDEPRIHFAIVCASIGCPRLLDEAYRPESIEKQLAANTRDFFSREQNFRIDGRTVYASSILKWFGKDFGDSQKQGLAGLSEYLPDKESRELVESGDYSIRYTDYDWSLNSQKS